MWKIARLGGEKLVENEVNNELETLQACKLTLQSVFGACGVRRCWGGFTQPVRDVEDGTVPRRPPPIGDL